MANVHSDIWGDESEIVRSALDWAERRAISDADPKTTARPAGELTEAAGEIVGAGGTVTAGGIGHERALRVFDEVLVPATRSQDDPLNLAYIPAAPTAAAVAFDLATSAANIFAGTWEAGAGAIWAENEALRWLIRLLGWPDTAEGCFVSGGTTGNLSALMTARDAAKRKLGRRPETGWKLACTADAHSSIRSAANVLDVEVVTVPGDDRDHLTGPALRKTLEEHENVFAVVASAGTTNAGLVDDLQGVAEACADKGIWLHVDGAYGGAALTASSTRELFAGIELADSFIVDPHKWLFAPYDCCALIYRDPEPARLAHAQTAGYLLHLDRQAPNPTDLAIHLSRRARGLSFWFSLATHGTDRYAVAVERALATAKRVAKAVDEADHLRLCCEPELSVVLFERPGWSDEQYAEWSHRLAVEGTILCLTTRWHERTVLRMAFVNPATDADQVIEVLNSLR